MQVLVWRERWAGAGRVSDAATDTILSTEYSGRGGKYLNMKICFILGDSLHDGIVISTI